MLIRTIRFIVIVVIVGSSGGDLAVVFPKDLAVMGLKWRPDVSPAGSSPCRADVTFEGGEDRLRDLALVLVVAPGGSPLVEPCGSRSP